MFKFIQHYFRSLLKRKLLSVITIGGFSLSMAVILLLIIFISGEKNVNKSFPNAENIYRLKRGEETLMPAMLLDNAKEEIPGIESICMYSLRENLFQIDNTKTHIKCLATNDAFLDIFSLEFIYQLSDPTLNVKDHAIISNSFSKKWFGDIDPVGKIIKDSYNSDYKIVGVISDPPINSSIDFDIIVSLEKGYAFWTGSEEDNITHRLFNSFVRLRQNVDPENAGSQVSVALNKWALFKNDKVSLQPLSKVYFDTSSGGDHLPHANVNMLYLLTSIAIVILMMAVFNYVNLTISSGTQRLKEIGIKKTTGASARNIFMQFLYEGLLVTLISFILASVFAGILSPVLSGILDKEIKTDTLISMPEVWMIILIVFFVTGISSGIFPALAFSKYSPLQMVSKKLSFGKQTGRGTIVAIQFVIAIALIVSVFFIKKQINYIKHKDLGINSELIVRLNLDGDAQLKSSVLKEKLLANPNIISVAGSSGSIMEFEGWGSMETEIDGQTKTVDYRSFGIDDKFIDLFGIKIVSGENISYTDDRFTCLINERYYKHLGWEDYLGRKIQNDQIEVIGIVEDFNFDDLHREIGFLVLTKSYLPNVLSIKINGNIPENLAFIKNCYHEVEPTAEFNYAFYDDWIQSMYDKEEQQAKAVRIFALFALTISCLGLIGLIELTTIKKIKEIGIRKVNGAKVSEILTMLNKDFVKWAVIAFVIATPIAYYAMNKWLESFAYKTTLSWWIFALAGLLALGIALLTVSWQSWRAATRNPVEALRYE